MAKVFISIQKNLPPTVDDNSISVVNGGLYIFRTNDFTVNYQDLEGDVFGSIIITSLPSTGELQFSGTTLSTGDLPFTVVKADLDDGKLAYQADPSNTLAHNTEFIFKVCDYRNACGY